MESYPRLTEYLARLPLGLDSFPRCRAKSSLLRGILDALEEVPGLDADPRLSELIAAPPPPSAWIPEVHFVAAHYVIADALEWPTSRVMQWTYEANRALTESPLYRALAKVASPNLLLKGASMSWGLIHRGSRLSVTNGDRSTTIELLHPPHVYSDLAHESAATGFRAVVEAAGGAAVDSRVVESRPDGARFTVSWRVGD